LSKTSAELMWWLLPAVRKLKPPSQSRLYGLLQAVGAVLDELRVEINRLRLVRFAAIADTADSYYPSTDRSQDLDRHAGDRGLRRRADESDAELLERILTLPYRNRFLGTKAGMKYLIEDIQHLRCEQIVEYYADDQAWIILSEADQQYEVETNLSHVFSENDTSENTTLRSTRMYSQTDLTQAFHFWILVSNPSGVEYDSEVVRGAINAAKPAHTRAVVYFQG